MLYVRPSDPNKPDAPITGQAIQVSEDRAIGMIAWRQGRELYFMTRNWEVMAVDVETTPTFEAGTPRMLFSLPGPRDAHERVTAEVMTRLRVLGRWQLRVVGGWELDVGNLRAVKNENGATV